jgi:sulfide dehydrogenase [flavocytochrome c] flavoprotein subunit
VHGEARRKFLRSLLATAALAGAWRPAFAKSTGRVVIVGAGYGGASVAHYLRIIAPTLEVLLIERNADFVSCPMSNLVLGGSLRIEDITLSYRGLEQLGVRVIHDEVVDVDIAKQRLRLASTPELAYDRLVVAPGIDFMLEQIPGLNNAEAQQRMPSAWRPGPEIALLRRQLEAMPDGGVFAINVPTIPFRCPPAPYERACQVARYFKQAKPKSKVIVLDANEEIVSKKSLFLKAWSDHYPGMIDYRNNSEVQDVDIKEMAVKLDFDTVKADVVNLLPPMKAGAIAQRAGLITTNGRWCDVNWLTMESTAAPGVHVLGDATFAAPLLPKSGQIANQQAKVAAAAIAALMSGREPDRDPTMQSICYSFVDDRNAVHIGSTHKYDAADKTMKVVPGSADLSTAASEAEGRDAKAWAKNIWAEMLG